MGGGGIRVGEMERDGFLSHGAAYVTMDRLLECSDKTYMPVCTLCGRTIGTEFIRFDDDDVYFMRQWRAECAMRMRPMEPQATLRGREQIPLAETLLLRLRFLL